MIRGQRLTSLGSGREKGNLDLLLPQLVGKLGDGIPGTFANGFLVLSEIIDEVYLSSGIDSDLITGANAETRVISRAKVHDAFAGCRVGLLVEGALYGKAF